MLVHKIKAINHQVYIHCYSQINEKKEMIDEMKLKNPFDPN